MNKNNCRAKDPNKCRYHNSLEKMSPSEYLNYREASSNDISKPIEISEDSVRESFNNLQLQLAELRANPTGKGRQEYQKSKAKHEKLRDGWLERATAVREDLTSTLNTKWSLNTDQIKNLREQVRYAHNNKEHLTPDEQESLNDLADACENANFHADSIKLSASVGLSKAIQDEKSPVVNAWSIVYEYGDKISQELKDRINSQEPTVWDRAISTKQSREEMGL